MSEQYSVLHTILTGGKKRADMNCRQGDISIVVRRCNKIKIQGVQMEDGRQGDISMSLLMCIRKRQQKSNVVFEFKMAKLEKENLRL